MTLRKKKSSRSRLSASPQLWNVPRIVDASHDLFAPPRSTFALDLQNRL